MSTRSSKRFRRLSFSFGVVSLLVIVQPPSVAAVDGITVTDLGIAGSFVAAINDVGQVVGTTEDTQGIGSHGFLWDSGATTPIALSGADDINSSGQVVGYQLDSPRGGTVQPVVVNGGVATLLGGFGEARATNDAGQIAGYRLGLRPDNEFTPTVWQVGVATELPIPIDSNHGGYANDINESGQIAGIALDLFANPHAVLWDNGVATDLGEGEAEAINDLGQVVGTVTVQPPGTETQFLATMWDHGNVVSLGSGVALGINNAGQVVGYRVEPENHWVPVMWQDGVETVLPLPDGFLQMITADINNAGQIVGTVRDSAGNPHVLLWTLPSEPAELTIPIDIRPGDHRNRINLRSHDDLRVALLSTTAFDATTVNVETVCFGDAEDANQRDCSARHKVRQRDLDHDGLLDLVLRFDTRDSGIDKGDTQACLSGETVDGRLFSGCDAITIKSHGHSGRH